MLYPLSIFYFLIPKGREFDRALRLFKEMKKSPPEAMTAPNQYTYNALIGVLTFSGCLDVAAETFREMKEVRGKGKRGEARDSRDFIFYILLTQ